MTSRKPAARIAVMHDASKPLQALTDALQADAHCVVGCLPMSDEAPASLSMLRPDLVMVCVDVPTDDALAVIGRSQCAYPRPMALIAERNDPRLTRRVICSGVSDYVVGALDLVSLGAVFEVAVTRFEWQQQLQKSLHDARTRLADQRNIGRAKGLLMKRRELDEEQAYQLLRSMAMRRKQPIGELSRQLLEAALAI